jgi:hypothetical protein
MMSLEPNTSTSQSVRAQADVRGATYTSENMKSMTAYLIQIMSRRYALRNILVTIQVVNEGVKENLGTQAPHKNLSRCKSDRTKFYTSVAWF